MLPLIPIFLLLLTALVMVAIRAFKPNFSYFWLVAAAGAFIAWPVMLFMGLRLPLSTPLPVWNTAALAEIRPFLLVDSISWPYGLAVSTMALGVILTAVARLPGLSWRAWSGSLSMAALGLLAVFAGNPATLLLSWAALDMAEVIILLYLLNQSAARERVVSAFLARVGGILFLLLADMSARQAGQSLSFSSITPQTSVYLLLAAGLRLGVLPLHVPFLQEPPLRRGLGTAIRLVPVAASLVLLSRAAIAGMPTSIAPILLAFTGLAALVGAWGWLTAADELNGRPYWILSTAALAVAGAIRAQPAASLAWGVSGILAGSLLFLASTRHTSLRPLLLAGLLAITGLPFTPSWNGLGIYAYPKQLQIPGFTTGLERPAAYLAFTQVFLLVHALLLAGYARHALRVQKEVPNFERWVWAIYPFGLAILPGALFLLGWLTHPQISQMLSAGWWASLAACLLAGGLWLLHKRIPSLPASVLPRLRSALSLSWLYGMFWAIYRLFAQLFGWMATILEGDGGVLWAMVLVALLLTLLQQQGFLGG